MRYTFYKIKHVVSSDEKSLRRLVHLIDEVDGLLLEIRDALRLTLDESDRMAKLRSVDNSGRIYATGFNLSPIDMSSLRSAGRKAANDQLELMVISRVKRNVWRKYLDADPEIKEGYLFLMSAFNRGEVDKSIYTEARNKFIENVL